MPRLDYRNRRWTYSIAAMVLAFGFLKFVPTAHAQDYMIRAHGVWQCSSQGKVMPLAGAHVQLINADVDIETAGTNWDDHQMTGPQAVGFTDANGQYTVMGYGSHGWPFGEKPNVYVSVALSDEHGVRLANQINQEFSVNTRQDVHKQVGEKGQVVDVDIGTWVMGLGGNVGTPDKVNGRPSEPE